MTHCFDLSISTQYRNKDAHDMQGVYKSRQKNNKSNSLDYKGMTLQQYFRKCSQIQSHSFDNQINETEEQNICSSNQAVTPSFNQYNSRQKIKTEMFQDKQVKIKQKGSNSHKQKNFQMLNFQNKTKQLRLQKIRPQITNNQPKNPKQLKNVHLHLNLNTNTQASSHSPGHLPTHTHKPKNIPTNTLALLANKSHLNRSTVTSFYQLEVKKKKMLDKVKVDRQRINQFKLSDVCFITKYGEKFCLKNQKGF